MFGYQGNTQQQLHASSFFFFFYHKFSYIYSIYDTTKLETGEEGGEHFASFLKGGEDQQMFALRSETVRM